MRDRLAMQAQPVMRVILAIEDFLATLVTPAQMAQGDLQVLLAAVEHQETQAIKEHLVTLETQDHLVLAGQVGLAETPELPVTPEILVHLEMLAILERLALQGRAGLVVPLVMPVTQEISAHLEMLETQVLMVLLAQAAPLATQELPVTPELPEHPVTLETQVLMVLLGQVGRQATAAPLATQEISAHLEMLETQVLMDQQAPAELLDLPVHPVTLETQASKAVRAGVAAVAAPWVISQDLAELVLPGSNQERRPVVMAEPVATGLHRLQDLQAIQAVLVVLATQEMLVAPEPPAVLEIPVLPAWLVMLATLGLAVTLAPGLRQETLVVLLLTLGQAKQELLETQVTQVLLVMLAPEQLLAEPAVLPLTLGQVNPASPVMLVMPVHLVMQVLVQAQLTPQQMEVLDCQELLVILVTLELAVMWERMQEPAVQEF
jgi:hypothetical protein